MSTNPRWQKDITCIYFQPIVLHMRNERLFAYGTIRQASVQLELFGRLLDSCIDTIQGFRITVIYILDGSTVGSYPALVAGSLDDTIDGLVVSLTEAELIIADEYETDHYRRIKVKLQSGGEAWAYVKNAL